ncbi:hypothetical protein EO087_14660 [Dyella sp. M7H15-1]|nr:hypothetical protein EO087_14660 [Dyella sp. M7H15-1]
MIVDEAEAQTSGATSQGTEQYSGEGHGGAEAITAWAEQTKAEKSRLMEAVVERNNLMAAYQKVVRNGGGPGVDGVPVGSLRDWLKVHWPRVKEALLDGRYLPAAVRAVDIPKPSGGVRTLGIPTVLDRLIQQAVLQILQPIVEPSFSRSSYGFRPGRNAHQAVKAAKQYVQQGHRWVVDIDLEKFFDRVNHDMLMSRVARHVEDERVLKLIRRYLEAGLMRDGMIGARETGTPQGGPLTPRTMLHTFHSVARIIRILAGERSRLRINPEHNDDVVLVDFDALDQAQYDPALRFQVKRAKFLAKGTCKFLKPIDDQK